MAWGLPPFAALVAGSAVVAGVVGVASLRQRPDPMAWPLSLLMFSVAAWAFPHAIALGFESAESAALWHRIRYPGTVAAPVLYLVVALRYANYERWLSRRVYALLSVVPVVSVVLVWTNPAHHLVWTSLAITEFAGASIFTPEVGPWYWVLVGYLYSVALVGLAIFLIEVIRSGRVYRKQAGLMFLAGVVPLVANVSFNLGIGPDPTVDLTAVSLAVTGVTFALALFHFDLLDLRPIARDRLMEEFDDGVVVIGPQGRIRDFNETAAMVVDGLAVDRSAEAVFSPEFAADGGEVVATVDGEERMFRVRSTSLLDDRDRSVGRLVHLNEITGIVEREQRISVLNRILRHNIRNELNVATGHLEALQERVPTDEADRVERIEDSLGRVVEFADRARYVERTLRETGDPVTADVPELLDGVLTETRSRYPEATIEVEVEVDATARVVDERLFEMAVSELLENAVVHNDRESPRVVVRVDAGPETVDLRIADDGPGIPEEERITSLTRIETGLEHGSGLGLWLVKWTMSLSAGDIDFEANDPRGTVVTVTLPRASADAGGEPPEPGTAE